VRTSRFIMACSILLCTAAGARPPGQVKIHIGCVSVEGLEQKVAADIQARLSEEISSLGVPVTSHRGAAAGVLEVRVLRSGDMVRITMCFFDEKGIKVLEITTTGAAEGFPASVSLRRDLKRGLEALGLSVPKPAVEEAPGIEAAYTGPAAGELPAAAVKTEKVRAEKKPGSLNWGWVVAGVGGALLAGGAVTGSLALSQNDDLNGTCPGGICQPGHEDEIDRLESLGYATDILLSVGAATAVAGVILLLFFESDDDGLSVQPSVGAGFSGAVVRGRF
jgi:hypothetical protein